MGSSWQAKAFFNKMLLPTSSALFTSYQRLWSKDDLIWNLYATSSGLLQLNRTLEFPVRGSRNEVKVCHIHQS